VLVLGVLSIFSLVLPANPVSVNLGLRSNAFEKALRPISRIPTDFRAALGLCISTQRHPFPISQMHNIISVLSLSHATAHAVRFQLWCLASGTRTDKPFYSLAPVAFSKPKILGLFPAFFNAVMPSSPFALTSAPASTNALTVSRSPEEVASFKAVSPFSFISFTLPFEG